MTLKQLIATAALSLTLQSASILAQTAGDNSPASPSGAATQSNQSNQTNQSGDSGRPAYRKGVIELNLGGLKAGGDLKPVFSNGFTGGVNFGYRFNRYLQADFGFDLASGAANVNRTINTTGGARAVGDDEFFMPMGGRLVLPLAKERALISAGGGLAYLRYSEAARGAANEIVICSSCDARSGFGTYELVQVQFLVDRQRHVGLGFTAKFFQARTSGDGLGTALRSSSDDRWRILSGTLSFHF